MMSERSDQIKKLRRRIEDFLRKSDVKTLIKIAEFAGIQVQNGLKKQRNISKT